ncbi:MAG: hypothetical protein GWP19_09580, partial [Planctomycetia bacterium]|nr:hypothetical protein [Planctomycetia bacterium]
MSRQNTDVCPICHISSDIENRGNLYSIHCPKCGLYKISGTAFASFGVFSLEQQANISGWIREHQSFVFSSDDKKWLSTLITPSIGEKAKKLLIRLSNKYPIAGHKFNYFNYSLSKINEFLTGEDLDNVKYAKEFLELLGTAWSIDERELY